MLYWSCRLHQPSSTPIAIATVYYWGVPGELADHGNLVHKNMWSASFLIQALKRQHRSCIMKHTFFMFGLKNEKLILLIHVVVLFSYKQDVILFGLPMYRHLQQILF